MKKLGLVFFLLLVPVYLWADTAPVLSDKALALARDLRASRMGVDREGNLWTWDFGTGRINLYSAGGEEIATANLKDVLGLDVDQNWGVAAVIGQGRELRLVPFTNGSPISIALPDAAGGVAWIDADTVAIAPTLTNHRAEIWNIRDKSLLKTLGTEEVIEPKIGTTILRAVDLHYDDERDLLYSLETFHGDLKVFALDGRLIRHEAFPAVERRDLDDWLAQTDRDNREAHEVFTPGIAWFYLAEAADGTAWSVLTCDRAHSRATFLAIPRLGKSRTVISGASCCSLPLAIWKDRLITYSDPAAPREICNLVRRIP